MLQKTKILGIDITTSKESEILEFIQSNLEKPRSRREKIVIFTPNPEQISEASRHEGLKTMLNEASISLPDGVGLVMASRMLGLPIKTRIAGVDFVKTIVKTISKRPIKTGYLGGQPGVAERASECLKKMSSELLVTYASDVYDKEKMIGSDVDILFVALGFPKQEKWILLHKDEIPATVIMAVGGALDFIAGDIPRAPKFLRSIGLEWLFRLIVEPWRFFRQLRIWHFGGLILLETLSSRVKFIKSS